MSKITEDLEHRQRYNDFVFARLSQYPYNQFPNLRDTILSSNLNIECERELATY